MASKTVIRPIVFTCSETSTRNPSITKTLVSVVTVDTVVSFADCRVVYFGLPDILAEVGSLGDIKLFLKLINNSKAKHKGIMHRDLFGCLVKNSSFWHP